MTNKSITQFNKNKPASWAPPGLGIVGAIDPRMNWRGRVGGEAYASTSLRPSTFLEAAISEATSRFERHITELKSPPSPGALFALLNEKSIEEKIFDATASVKILTAQVAMHLERELREKLFRQLDSLHDPVGWEPGDLPVQQSSFATFLKAICQIRPKCRPGLGLSSAGHLIAAWTAGEDRLTIEFLANDRVRWVLTRNFEDGPERFAAQTSVARLYERLTPYHPEHWFSYEEN